MATSQLPQLGANADFEQVKSVMIQWQDYLNWFFRNLDSLNVKHLTADHVDTGTLDANKVAIAADDGSFSYTLDSAGIRANNGSVNTLDFDLATGLLTIVSALIQSATGYPRVELNNATNLIGAYLDANNAIRVVPSRLAGTPAVEFFSGGSVIGFMQDLNPILAFLTQTGGRHIQIGSGNKLFLTANTEIDMQGPSLKINGSIGKTTSIQYVKDVIAGAPSYGNMNFTNGILTSNT